MLVADIDQYSKKIFRRNDKAAFAQNWLRNNGSYIFRCDYALECVFQVARTEQITSGILQGIRATIAVGVGDSIDFARERSEPSFVGMSLAGQRQRHHGAPVKSVLEGDHARPPG